MLLIILFIIIIITIISDCYVIIDSLNYIKGFRYELYCIARSIRSPHCVCWTQCDNAISLELNSNLKQSLSLESYDEKILLDLRLRFEEPHSKNRWDNPLFVINMTPIMKNTITEHSLEQNLTSTLSLSIEKNGQKLQEEQQKLQQQQSTIKSSWKKKDSKTNYNQISNDNDTISDKSLSTSTILSSTTTGKTVFFSGTEKSIQETVSGISHVDAMEQIWNHFIGASVPLPNSSTIAAPKSDAERLYELDRISQLITQTIIQHQVDFNEGDPIIFSDYDRTLTLHRHVSLIELQRHRRQYVKITGQYSANTNSTKDIGASFLDFLNLHL